MKNDSLIDIGLILFFCLLFSLAAYSHYNEVLKNNAKIQSIPIEWQALVTSLRDESTPEFKIMIFNKFIERKDLPRLSLENVSIIMDQLGRSVFDYKGREEERKEVYQKLLDHVSD